jgi:NAD(P)-dependent dehydrogenase (short-subunit alcohol dehydrogenase family)
MASQFSGKTIIVTGGGAGIGAATCRLLAERCANVVCTDIDGERAERVAASLRGQGHSALGLAVDVTQERATEEMAEQALASFGAIDGLYANAGIAVPGTAQTTSLDAWSRTLAINLTGVWLSAKAVLPAMLAAGRGSIVVQGSTVALRGHPRLAAYSASKGGAVALVRQMAVDYGPLGIRVNAVIPGTTRTELLEEMYRARAAEQGTDPEDDLRRTSARYPVRRLGTPAEIGEVAAFLLSDDSSFVSGAVYAVDGGLMSNGS